MPVLHLLGTGAAVCDPHRTTTMLALEWEGRSLLIDCGGDLFQRTLQAGIDPDGIEGLIITHEHPDHVSGFPLFMERIWLAGRTRPLPVYGIAPALAQAQRVLEAFQTTGWNLPEICWHRVSLEEHAPVLRTDSWNITGSPGTHGVPVIGLRAEYLPGSVVVAYSADTQPCPELDRLCVGCDILVHEATGSGNGHSSISEAVSAGVRCGASHLILVHLSPGVSVRDLASFQGNGLEVILGEDLDRFEF